MSTRIKLQDETVWPDPFDPEIAGDSETYGLSWRLTYGHFNKNDLCLAASIIRAYEAILRTPKRAAEIKRAQRAKWAAPKSS